MVAGIFYIRHSVGAVGTDRIDSHAYEPYRHTSYDCVRPTGSTSSPGYVRLKMPEMVLRPNPWMDISYRVGENICG